jgi:hypothetical protein
MIREIFTDVNGKLSGKRVGGYMCLITGLICIPLDLIEFFTANERLVEAALGAGVLLIGASVAEKIINK